MVIWSCQFYEAKQNQHLDGKPQVMDMANHLYFSHALKAPYWVDISLQFDSTLHAHAYVIKSDTIQVECKVLYKIIT